jgi:choloylglycine hydrolase
VLDTGFETVTQAFHILNNFDIPIGSQHERADIPKGLPSGTQFTAATDLKAMKLYYRTAWNSNIRCIDLINIDFHKVKYQSHPLDKTNVQPVESVKIHSF